MAGESKTPERQVAERRASELAIDLSLLETRLAMTA
jgi:hypothetical protein